jgi:hypothetical protein
VTFFDVLNSGSAALTFSVLNDGPRVSINCLTWWLLPPDSQDWTP